MAQLSMVAVAKLAYDAGIRDPRKLAEAVAIATAESGRNPDAVGDVALQNDKWGPSVGLWQIRSLKAEKGTGKTRDADRLKDPTANAKAMVEISSGGANWRPWTVTSPANLAGFAKYTAAMPQASATAAGVVGREGAEVVGGEVSGAVDGAAQLAGVISDAAQTPAKMINWLTEGSTWLRIGYFTVGFFLVVGGSLALAGKPIGSTVKTVGKLVLPSGKAAKAASVAGGTN